MPDRTLDKIEDIFQNVSMEYSPQDRGMTIPNSTAEPEGHFATTDDLVNNPEGHPVDNDPVFTDPEHLLSGYLAPADYINFPFPFITPISSATPISIIPAPVVLSGFSIIPSASCIVAFYDLTNLSVPAMQFGLVATAGNYVQLRDVFFPHGLAISNTAAATLTGGLIIRRRLDSVPK